MGALVAANRIEAAHIGTLTVQIADLKNATTAVRHAQIETLPAAPGGGWGAWEVALRYADTDLNFHAESRRTAPAEASHMILAVE